MSNTDRTSGADSRKQGSLDPDAPVLDDNAKAGYGEKGPPVPTDDQAGLNEAEKLDDAVADLDKE